MDPKHRFRFYKLSIAVHNHVKSLLTALPLPAYIAYHTKRPLSNESIRRHILSIEYLILLSSKFLTYIPLRPETAPSGRYRPTSANITPTSLMLRAIWTASACILSHKRPFRYT